MRVSEDNLGDADWFTSKRVIEEFRAMLREGHIGYFVYSDGKCVCRRFVFTHRSRATVGEGFIFALKSDELFLGWGETAQEYRGRGISPYMLSHIAREFQGRNIYIYIDRKNEANIRSVAKAGFSVYLDLLLVKVRNWRFYIVLKGDNFKYPSRLGGGRVIS